MSAVERHSPAPERVVRAVLFDVGETLWHSPNPPSNRAFRQMAADRAAAFCRQRGIAFAEPALAARTAWDAMETAMRRARLTDLAEPDYGAVAANALRGVGLSLSADVAKDFLEAIYVSGPEGGKVPIEGARETLLALRERGFQLAVVTNRSFGGERFRLDMREAGLDIHWDAMAVSVEVGFLKPHHAVFEYALAQLGESAADALMVGNSLSEDIAGAQALGIAAVWCVSPPDAENVAPDYSITEVTALLELPILRGRR